MIKLFGYSGLLMLLAFSEMPLAQDSVNIYDPQTSTLRISNLVVDGAIYEYVNLKFNGKGTLDIIDTLVSVGTSAIPTDATFFFLGNLGLF